MASYQSRSDATVAKLSPGEQMPEVFCMGHANLDIMVYSALRTRPGGDFLVKDLEVQPGGSAANTAVALARLGSRVSFIGRVGNDVLGDFIDRTLRREGVDVRLIQRDQAEPTGTAVIFVLRGGEKTMFAFVGANGNVTLDSKQYKRLRRANLFHLSGYSLVEKTSGDTALVLMRQAKKYRVKISIDLGLRPTQSKSQMMETAMRLADILIANEVEASLLSGEKDPFSAGHKLLLLGPAIVVIKLGKHGAALFTEKKMAYHKGYRVSVTDTTGAGDAFNAGFISASLQGFDFDESLAFANAVAAIKVMGKGAQASLPRTGEVVEFMKSRSEHR